MSKQSYSVQGIKTIFILFAKLNPTSYCSVYVNTGVTPDLAMVDIVIMCHLVVVNNMWMFFSFFLIQF